MGAKWVRKWAGGRVRITETGKEIWVIERKLAGHAYTKTLDVASERAALAELALFERDPSKYATRREQLAGREESRVEINAALVERFLAHLKQHNRSERYRRNVRDYLSRWAAVLAGRDLRTVTLKELKQHLRGWGTAEKHRIISLKTFCSYLRKEEGLLQAHEDATLQLAVPPAIPERSVRLKGYSMEEVAALYRRVDDQSVRDVLMIASKTGMHFTEIERLAAGEGEIRDTDRHPEIAGTFKFIHKNGRIHLYSVDGQTLAAAKRLRARGSAPVESWVRRTIAAAAKAFPVTQVRVGQLRHSFVAWSVTYGRKVKPANAGVSLAEVAATIGHLTPRTTQMFYNVTEVPEMIALPLKLVHPSDPVALATRTAVAGATSA